mmetsp:Transcript_11455/g.26893  ORF Transcript_11455/g.26893 Transcript_11455/m.26893 type:complete len:901 (+) Transcript_11455:175-2877(+)
MGSPRRNGSSSLQYSAEHEEESSTMSAGNGATSPKKNRFKKRSGNSGMNTAFQRARDSPSLSSSSSVAASSAPKTALHDQLYMPSLDTTTTPSRLSRKPSFLSRLSTMSENGTPSIRRQRKELKKKKKQQQREERRTNNFQLDIGNTAHQNPTVSLESPPVVISPTTSVQTTSNTGRRRKPGILFLKRVLSSPPVLLQRLQNSTPLNKEKERYASDGSCYQESNNSSSNNNNNNNSNSVVLNPNNDDNDGMVEKISIVAESFTPSSRKNGRRRSGEDEDEDNQKKDLNKNCEREDADEIVPKMSCNATSIFHHSFSIESICGIPEEDLYNDNNKSALIFEESNRRLMSRHMALASIYGVDELRRQQYRNHPYRDSSRSIMSEDPTVQESIECIFASQLEDGLKLWDDEHDDGGERDTTERLQRHNNSFETINGIQSSGSTTAADTVNKLISPADLQQSRMNRKDRKSSNRSLYASMSQSKKRYEQASLVYVGTFDPSCPSPSNAYIREHSTNDCSHIDNTLDSASIYNTINPLPCRCATRFLPAMEPKDWPQAPIALRPTPGSGTKVKAIRLCGSDDPLWVPGSHLTWSQSLARRWGKEEDDQSPHFACCEQCVILPINNGNENPGESLVIDFESDLFEGTLLLRLRHSEGTTPEAYDDSKGYFAGVNRRYQACIRGRFKKILPFTELHTGFRLRRKFGKLPSKWVLKSALKVVSFFAPQLDIKLEGVEQPYSVTPLGSTPQCITVDDEIKETSGCAMSSSEGNDTGLNSLEGVKEESTEPHRSLLGLSLKGERSLQRAKIRKKAFDKLYVQKSSEPKTDPSKIYTFEFLQHMLNFQDFTIELGSVMGSLELKEMLDGQPLQVMSEHEPSQTCLWSFDVWNECLWESAKEHDVTSLSSPR